jgi:hypothetical protein
MGDFSKVLDGVLPAPLISATHLDNGSRASAIPVPVARGYSAFLPRSFSQ